MKNDTTQKRALTWFRQGSVPSHTLHENIVEVADDAAPRHGGFVHCGGVVDVLDVRRWHLGGAERRVAYNSTKIR